MSEVSDSDGGPIVLNHEDLTELAAAPVHVIKLQPDASPTAVLDSQPPVKRQRLNELLDGSTGSSPMPDGSIKQILFSINKAICLRLDSIESKLEAVVNQTNSLESKLDHVTQQMRNNQANSVILHQNRMSLGGRRSGAVIVGLPQDKGGGSDAMGEDGVQSLGPNVTLITLNSEEDFPHGCWLGDENNPEMRVRAPIMPSDLLHVHSNCRTAEKMALTLLDYLFDRETQAHSNLSGMGKHGKRQLDPLMIYGIRCHLIHKFAISEQDWHRIKQNIDSKCRTAFRRRVKGMPLQVKAFRGKAPPTYAYVAQGQDSQNIMHEIAPDDLQQVEDGQLHISEGEVDIGNHPSAAEIIQNAGGEIQVLHATPEQVAQLQQTHQIQILQGDQVLQQMHSGGTHVSVSMPEGFQVINATTGTPIIASEPGESIQVHNTRGGQPPATNTDDEDAIGHPAAETVDDSDQ